MLMIPELYVCYGDPDEERVGQLYDRLLAARLNPWMRSKDIRAGEDAKASIEKAIELTERFLVVLSSRSSPDSQEIDAIVEQVPPREIDVWDNITIVWLDEDRLEIEDLSPRAEETLRHCPKVDLSKEKGWDPLLAELTGYAPSSLPELKVPHDLVQACADGQCILFAGDGLSTLAGFPPRRAFILGLLDWAMEKELPDIDPGGLRAWRPEVKTGDAELIANNIYEALYRPFEAKAAQTSRAAETHKRLEPLYAYLRDIYARPGTPPPESQVLTEVGFAAAMTTNLDHLLEATFVGADPPFFTPENTEGLREAFAKREFFTLKLYGSVHEPDTLCIAPAQFKDRVLRNEPFVQFIQTLFLSRKMLFVGADLEAINTFLEAIQLRPRVEAPQHYALAPVVGSAWQAQADRLLSRYGIQVLPYALHEERRFVSFLQELSEKVQTRRRETVEVQKGPARLQSVRLENIGPFEVLELELHGHWNILLGDNGVGKSSILKAVAVGICGKDAQPYAHRLIRSGENSGTVTLETTEGARYVTEILKTDRGAEVRARTVRPLDAEGWLALGFPPLRSFSWTRPKGSEPQEPNRRATSDDLLPLIADEPDPRMDGLKEWVWYLDYLSSKQQDIESRGDGRYRGLLKEFFEVVDQLTTEVSIQLDHVNPETREITIITDDGKVPIETLSQGTESLIGWTGILLRRLYEMYGDEENPREKYALVLMDELDAHMHPAWQRTLVHNLSELFPNVQFIATTHSPLAIGGMDVRQVIRLVRDEEGRVVRREVDPDMTMGRTDQVLTGSLFGLETTLDKQTQDKIGRYRELVGKGKRDPDEEEEFQDLRKTLEFRIPAPQETLAERRAQELLQALLLEQVGADYPEVQQQLLEKAEQLLTAVQAQGGRTR